MRLLPEKYWRLEAVGRTIVAGIYEHPEGVRYSIAIDLSGSAQDLPADDDLKRVVIKFVEGLAPVSEEVA